MMACRMDYNNFQIFSMVFISFYPSGDLCALGSDLNQRCIFPTEDTRIEERPAANEKQVPP